MIIVQYRPRSLLFFSPVAERQIYLALCDQSEQLCEGYKEWFYVIRLTSVCVCFLCRYNCLGFHRSSTVLPGLSLCKDWQMEEKRHAFQTLMGMHNHRTQDWMAFMLVNHHLPDLECCCMLTYQPTVWEDPTTPSCHKCCNISWVRDPKILQSRVYV